MQQESGKINHMKKKQLTFTGLHVDTAFNNGKEQGIKLGIEQQKKDQHIQRLDAYTKLIGAVASSQESIARMVMAIEKY